MIRDEFFAGLWAGDEQWGEVMFNISSNSFDITIFSPRAGGKYVFGLPSVQALLQEAQQRLIRLGYGE